MDNKIRWADLETCHLWNIARMLMRSISERRDTAASDEKLIAIWHKIAERPFGASPTRLILDAIRCGVLHGADHQQRTLAFAIDELAYRDELPTYEDIDKMPRTFVELWVGYSGMETRSEEYRIASASTGAPA